MLTPQQRAQAANKLKDIEAQLGIQEEIKKKITTNSKIIIQLIQSLNQNPKEQLQLIRDVANNTIFKKIHEFECRSQWVNDVEQLMKATKQKLNKERIKAFDQKERAQAGIEQIKETIVKIRKTVKESVEQQQKKRKKIQDDLEKSLSEIRQKIDTFNKESEQMEKQNIPLRQKIANLKQKMEGFETEFKVKAEEKDEQVKVEKQELLEKLRILDQEFQRVTELNKKYSTVQRKNFDQKLSIHLRSQKFPQYSESFVSSANTIGLCKQELLKGVQRLNEARAKVEQAQQKCKQLSQLFLVELKKQTEKQKKIDSVKADKEAVRSRILELQSQIKAKKNPIS